MKPKIGKYYELEKTEVPHINETIAKCIAHGKIKNYSKYTNVYLFQFLKNVGGHDGNTSTEITKGKCGKIGRCWWLREEGIIRELTIGEVMVEQI